MNVALPGRRANVRPRAFLFVSVCVYACGETVYVTHVCRGNYGNNSRGAFSCSTDVSSTEHTIIIKTSSTQETSLTAPTNQPLFAYTGFYIAKHLTQQMIETKMLEYHSLQRDITRAKNLFLTAKLSQSRIILRLH